MIASSDSTVASIYFINKKKMKCSHLYVIMPPNKCERQGYVWKENANLIKEE